jgi:hypothetical protein
MLRTLYVVSGFQPDQDSRTGHGLRNYNIYQQLRAELRGLAFPFCLLP